MNESGHYREIFFISKGLRPIRNCLLGKYCYEALNQTKTPFAGHNCKQSSRSSFYAYFVSRHTGKKTTKLSHSHTPCHGSNRTFVKLNRTRHSDRAKIFIAYSPTTCCALNFHLALFLFIAEGKIRIEMENRRKQKVKRFCVFR